MSGRKAESSRGSSRRQESRRAAAAREVAPEPGLHELGYWRLSTRPLYSLALLLPLILAYELGSVFFLTSAGARKTIEAHKLLDEFFELFGVVGLYMPGVALATVLLVWHAMSRDRWELRLPTLGGMLAESLAWTMPLLVLSAAHSRAAAAIGAEHASAIGTALVQGGGEDGLLGLSWQARLTVSIGAGLYEEMLFRLVGIALLHFILHDLLGLKDAWASGVAVAVSAVGFALYHDTAVTGYAGGIDWTRLAFFSIAGGYLGTVYVLRGFGIVVMTHALYDILVLVLLSPR